MTLQLLIAAFLASCALAQADYSQFVNPLIGSEGPIPGQAFGGGDIFVGGAVPFGVAKVGIDTYEDNATISTLNGGYTPFGRVTAVSMMHESGTGGFPKYGIISQMPLITIDPPVNLLDNTTYWQRRINGSEVAEVGYFKTELENGVTIELSGARNSGIMQYSFPVGEKHVLVDVSHYLPSETGGYSSQVFLGGQIDLQPGGKIYTGYGTYGAGWNESAPYRVYFCGEFEEAPDQARTFRGRNIDPMIRYHTYSNEPYNTAMLGNLTEASGPLNDRVGAIFSWDDSAASQVRSKVGISFISAEKACAFKNSEIASWTLNETRDAAVQEWNQDVFGTIQAPVDDSQNRTNLVLLYSSLYFMHLMPSDRTGENPLWDSGEPYWDDFYTMWDIFRCTTTLHQLIQPAYYEEMIRSLIDIWRYEGYMPDRRSGNYNGLVQGGSNADHVLADAYVRGLRGNINWTAGYEAMVKDAEVQPYNTFSLDDPTGSVKEGRGALYDWLELGYLSSDPDYVKYLNRSANWQNLWAHNYTSPQNFTGFLAPRLSTGAFNLTDYNLALCGGCEWSDISYEATPFEYSFTVPHDLKTLITFIDGPEAFENRLDYIFQPNTSEQNLGANGAGISTLMNIGNEPDFATPYHYHYLNKQAKSVQRNRALANQYFHDANYGVPGNSDAGALNSWLIWQMLGMYPIATTTTFLIGSPWFSEVNITVNGDRQLRILATGLDYETGSYYVQSVRLNGETWERDWFEHADLMVEGGTLEFELGTEMTAWETGAVPPSLGHVVL